MRTTAPIVETDSTAGPTTASWFPKITGFSLMSPGFRYGRSREVTFRDGPSQRGYLPTYRARSLNVPTPEHRAPTYRLRSLRQSRLLGNRYGRVTTVRAALLLAVIAAPLLVFQVGNADLDVYRHGASVLLHGHSLYTADFAANPGNHLPFTYPPFAAIAALVLLPLPERLTSELWAVATIVMLAWCVRVSFQPLLERRRARADLVLVAVTAVMLCTRPAFDHLGDGQVDIALMTMCLADTVTPHPRWPRGLLVGLATATKLVPGIFILYFWITGRRRAGAGRGRNVYRLRGPGRRRRLRRFTPILDPPRLRHRAHRLYRRIQEPISARHSSARFAPAGPELPSHGRGGDDRGRWA